MKALIQFNSLPIHFNGVEYLKRSIVFITIFLSMNLVMGEIAGAKDFDDITWEFIQSVNMSTQDINGSDNEENQIPGGTILLYKTDENRYGKMEILTYGYDLDVKWLTYDTDGSVYSSGTTLQISGTCHYNMDLGQKVSGTTINPPPDSDLKWVQQTEIERYIHPENGAEFSIYRLFLPGTPFLLLKDE